MKRWMKWLGFAVVGIAGVLVLVAAGVYGFSEARLRKQYTLATPALTIPTDSLALARGAHLTHSIAGCVDCHGENLSGGAVIESAALGNVYAVNLTRGKGGVGTLSDADYIRAIRHGVAPNGRALKIMPSSDYMNLSDADLAAIIAYVKTVPPVDKELPATTIGPLGRALFVAGKLPFLHAERIDHGRISLASVAPAATAGYGAYLAAVGCKGCHGPALAGGKIIDGPPDWPPAANLTPAGPTKNYSEEDFRRVLREGKRPSGIPVSDVMPWRLTKRMSDDEIQAIYLYLRTLPPTATPGLQTASR